MISALFDYLVPKRLLTKVAGRVARIEDGRIIPPLLRWFIGKYRVDLDEAAQPDLRGYRTFNDFFTRPLKPGVRPLAAADFVSPVDGAISQFGLVEEGRMLQAKGHRFTVTDLLGGDADLAAEFHHGSFATLYLSPRDYHRVHMPCAGRLVHMTYVPGTLFSVKPSTVRAVPGVFARNERIICLFNSSDHGKFAVVLVGATIVGSMATVWHGGIIPRRTDQPYEWSYDESSIDLKKGEEMGRFLLGSTVITLFGKGAISFNADWDPERSVRLGERMGDAPA